MTQEEKARAYDKAIERAKAMIKVAANQDEARGFANTIFPELKESEDEKIRKSIISGMTALKDQGKEAFATISINDCIAWLEKQGEQKFEMKSAAESLGVSHEEYNKIVDELIFGEQKAKENKGNLGGISPNWSEEDEDYLFLLNSICKDAEEKYRNSPDVLVRKEIANARNWLQSLKGRVQPKQEWSEDDEQHIDSLLKRLDALCRNKFERTRFAISEDRDWLKSLKERKGGKI